MKCLLLIFFLERGKLMGLIRIEAARPGDERTLAWIQTESWKAAFAEILPPEALKQATQAEQVEEMYRRVLTNSSVRLLIERVDGAPQAIAGWSQSRDGLGEQTAELICIHSLQCGWGQGYGFHLMNRLLEDMRAEGYRQAVLWVFEENRRARAFYERQGFVPSQETRQAFGAAERMYRITL